MSILTISANSWFSARAISSIFSSSAMWNRIDLGWLVLSIIYLQKKIDRLDQVWYALKKRESTFEEHREDGLFGTLSPARWGRFLYIWQTICHLINSRNYRTLQYPILACLMRISVREKNLFGNAEILGDPASILPTRHPSAKNIREALNCGSYVGSHCAHRRISFLQYFSYFRSVHAFYITKLSEECQDEKLF